jgi:hypothetical protein
LAITLTHHPIHAMQKDLEVLKSGHAQYAHDPYGPIEQVTWWRTPQPVWEADPNLCQPPFSICVVIRRVA